MWYRARLLYICSHFGAILNMSFDEQTQLLLELLMDHSGDGDGAAQARRPRVLKRLGVSGQGLGRHIFERSLLEPWPRSRRLFDTRGPNMQRLQRATSAAVPARQFLHHRARMAWSLRLCKACRPSRQRRRRAPATAAVAARQRARRRASRWGGAVDREIRATIED